MSDEFSNGESDTERWARLGEKYQRINLAVAVCVFIANLVILYLSW